MNKTTTLISLATLSAASALAQSAFTPNNILVERVGDGTALSSVAAAISLLEYQANGSLVQTLNLPTVGANRLTESGSATSNGYFNSYGAYVTVPGYNTALGTTGVAGTNTKAVNILGTDGSVASNVQVATTNWTGNNFRSAISVDGTTFFGSGAGSGTSSGIRFVVTDGSGIRVTSTATNTRNIEIYGGNLLFSTGAGTNGVYNLGAVNSLDLSDNDLNTATLLLPVSSAYGFYVDFDNGVAFVASDTTGTSGGVFRFDYNSVTEAWDQTWRFNLNTTNSEFTAAATGTGVFTARGLTADFDSVGGTYNVYLTTTESSNNHLVGFSDGLVTGITAGSPFEIIASAGANYVFRGVDFSPIPEPSSFAALAGLGVLGAAALRRRRRA